MKLSEAITKYGDMEINENMIEKLCPQQIKESKPKIKIDMSRCIESGIDSEFSEDKGGWFVSKLRYISDFGRFEDFHHLMYKYCRPRMNHIHASPTGWDKCPIPEGFIINMYSFELSTGMALCGSYKNYHSLDWTFIKMFEITDIAEDYEL